MARPLHLTLWLVAAALLAAATLPSAAQGASCTLSERVDARLKGTAKNGLVTVGTGRSRKVLLSFRYRRSGRRPIRLAAAPDIGVTVGDDGRGRLMLKRGRKARRLARSRAGRWNRVRLTLRAGKRPIRRVRVGRLAGTSRRSLRIDDLSLTVSDRSLCRRRKPARSRFFAPTSFWNTPLATRARLDARSKVWVGELRRQLAGTDPWINTTSYSTPVYTVPRHQPRVKVTVDPRAGSRNAWVSPSLTRQFAAVPIPAGARPAPGSDGHMVIWQPSTDTMWEFWVARRRNDGWHAIWGGQMTGVSRNPGHFTDGFGATATGLPLAGGLITIDELRRGRIDHALALAIPHTQIWHRFAAPAQRSDGDIDSPNAIPEGARLRLDPRLDIDSLRLPRTTRIVAKAIQKYGMIVRDKSGAVSLYAEDPARTGGNPYPGIFGMYPDRLFDRFPWHRLQVIKTEMRRP